MHPLLIALINNFAFSGSLPVDVPDFLILHNRPQTAVHTRSVVELTRLLAARFGLAAAAGETAAWLHDISAVYPNERRLEVSKQLGLEVLPQEELVPLLLHQKISAVIARDVFGILDPAVLDAIECHTTLKPGSTTTEMLVFVADKMAWDQKGTPPYRQEMEAALSESLEAAAWVYQRYLWHSGKAKVIHPWMQDSYLELKAKYEIM